MNVLSLFDGISCARIAIEKSGYKVNKYFSSELDLKCCEVSKKNYPDNIFLGDVNKIELNALPKIDILIGGSPCQDISHAFKGSGLDGLRSSLFYKFVDLKNKLNPKYFLLENVKSKWNTTMDDAIGVEGVEINSCFFSAQFRPRVYWTNINLPNIPNEISDDKIDDILDKSVKDKKYFFNTSIDKYFKDSPLSLYKTQGGLLKVGVIPRKLLKDNERQRRVYSIKSKSPTLLARADTTKILYKNRVRKLTPLECERLQGIPDNFTSGFSDTSRYKMIGNAFTVQVISKIISNIGKKNSKPRQVGLFA